MKQIRLQQGDSFTMNLILKNNGVPQDLQENESLAVGFYCENGYSKVFNVGDDNEYGILSLATNANQTAGRYTAFVSNNTSINFIGNVDVEIVIYSTSGDGEVSHANKIVKMYFEERKINDYIKDIDS